ncbi:hypothetical protein ACP70R_003819 [Stipagrostis hirtigluma subsp. patula]
MKLWAGPSGSLPDTPYRVDVIHRLVAGASAINTAHASKPDGVTIPVRWGAPIDDNNYIVTVGLGTPARLFSVELDTGSDLSWVQCKPCRGCYKQRDPLFDPARSSTFSAVRCGAPACQELAHKKNCSTDGEFPYKFFYAHGSQIEGNLVRDTLTLAPSQTLSGFVFGCGHDDTGSVGVVDGLIGLSPDKVSLASQAATKYGARFSYCLPSSSAAGYLSLGGAAPANTRFTAMVTRTDMDMPSLYYVNLVGIKVAGNDLNIPPRPRSCGAAQSSTPAPCSPSDPRVCLRRAPISFQKLHEQVQEGAGGGHPP